jgi:PTS system N-acetylgalactosamine-specific IIA component
MSEARAVVAGHGDYATGIISAVQQITGRGDMLVAISGAGRSAVEIEDLIRTTLVERSIRVIFTDLQAGSCSMAARRLMRGVDDAVIVCGANLPALLDFVMAEGLSPQEAAARALERGRGSMMLIAPPPPAAPAGGKPA